MRLADMKITTKGQVTIPADIRDELGLLPYTEVEFEIKGDAVLMRKADEKRRRGRRVVEHLRGRGDVRMSTDEIMVLARGRR
jgi:AbrB family looped-hinge helix DNA binding protein